MASKAAKPKRARPFRRTGGRNTQTIDRAQVLNSDRLAPDTGTLTLETASSASQYGAMLIDPAEAVKTRVPTGYPVRTALSHTVFNQTIEPATVGVQDIWIEATPNSSGTLLITSNETTASFGPADGAMFRGTQVALAPQKNGAPFASACHLEANQAVQAHLRPVLFQGQHCYRAMIDHEQAAGTTTVTVTLPAAGYSFKDKAKFHFYDGAAWDYRSLAYDTGSGMTWEFVFDNTEADVAMTAFYFEAPEGIMYDFSIAPSTGTDTIRTDGGKGVMKTYDLNMEEYPGITSFRITAMSLRVTNIAAYDSNGGAMAIARVGPNFRADGDWYQTISTLPYDSMFSPVTKGVYAWWMPRSEYDLRLRPFSQPLGRFDRNRLVAAANLDSTGKINVRLDIVIEWQSLDRQIPQGYSGYDPLFHAVLAELAAQPAVSENASHENMIARALNVIKRLAKRGARWALENPQYIASGLSMLAL